MQYLNFAIKGSHYNYTATKHSCSEMFKLTNKFTNAKGEAFLMYEGNAISLCLSKKNLIISVSITDFFKEGESLSTNFNELNLAQIKLSKFLKISLHHWQVTSLGVSLDVFVDQPIPNYLKQFGNPIGTTSSGFHGKVLQILTKKDVTIIYKDVSKKVNCEKHKCSKSLNFALRQTVKIQKDTLGTIGIFSAIDLCDIDAYEKLINFWYNSYKSIPKLSFKSSSEVVISTTADLVKWLSSEGLKLHGGAKNVLNTISNKIIHPKTKYSLRKYLEGIEALDSDNSELVREIDEKVLEIYKRELRAIENYKAAA